MPFVLDGLEEAEVGKASTGSEITIEEQREKLAGRMEEWAIYLETGVKPKVQKMMPQRLDSAGKKIRREPERDEHGVVKMVEKRLTKFTFPKSGKTAVKINYGQAGTIYQGFLDTQEPKEVIRNVKELAKQVRKGALDSEMEAGKDVVNKTLGNEKKK